ncbi:MAG: Na+/H+ antiporter NhaA [Alphaproteobacteria bacterium]|nr:Na+/H+ antiporter NhaA [Alphaproteobacteria bacterium]
MNEIKKDIANITQDITQFFKQESFAGIFLCLTAIIAMIIANTALVSYYDQLIDIPVAVSFGNWAIHKPLLLWVNDGLMAVFFFLVGLELKREFMEGELSSIKKIILPALGAIGGIALPALIYVAFNYDNPVEIQGWAIPAATDIAFALGVLALLGNRIPLSLKVLLTSIAIFDDIGAVVIIALFYTSKLSLFALGIGTLCCGVLFILNRMGVTTKSLYILMGIIMWVALLKSGVHATLSGVILAFFIPMADKNYPNRSPLKMMEHDLHYVVAFFILPVFAFCNAGVNLTGTGLSQIFHDVPLGIAAGLIFGKQIGVFTACWIGIKLKLTSLPEGTTWMHLYGLSVLCGIGFTMSLFIGGLAFEETGINNAFDERIGIIVGSLVSGLWGYLVLRYLCKKADEEPKFAIGE